MTLHGAAEDAASGLPYSTACRRGATDAFDHHFNNRLPGGAQCPAGRDCGGAEEAHLPETGAADRQNHSGA